jgi:hypothetical protein
MRFGFRSFEIEFNNLFNHVVTRFSFFYNVFYYGIYGLVYS